MTEVDGPPVPPLLRLSSLLIRGADGAASADTAELIAKIICDMAQAFDIPKGNTQRTWRLRNAQDSRHGTSSTLKRSPFPGPILCGVGTTQYGPGSAPLQAWKVARAGAGRPDSRVSALVAKG